MDVSGRHLQQVRVVALFDAAGDEGVGAEMGSSSLESFSGYEGGRRNTEVGEVLIKIDVVSNGEFIFGVLFQITGEDPGKVVGLRHGGAVGRAEVDDSDKVRF